MADPEEFLAGVAVVVVAALTWILMQYVKFKRAQRRVGNEHRRDAE